MPYEHEEGRVSSERISELTRIEPEALLRDMPTLEDMSRLIENLMRECMGLPPLPDHPMCRCDLPRRDVETLD